MRRLRKLVLDLNDLCDDFEYKYHINCGGCCYLAYLIARHLDDLNIKYSLRIRDPEEKNIKAITKEVKTKCKNSSIETSVSGENTCYHYYLYINGYGNINKSGSNRNFNSYEISDINYKNIYWIYKNGDWNCFYNTCNNKAIKRKLDKYFEKYSNTFLS